MNPVTMTISVSDYLKFQVLHNYAPGRDACHWSVLQFNGLGVDPMTMNLYGGSELTDIITKHILTEIENYVPKNAHPTQSLHICIQHNGHIGYEGMLEIHVGNAAYINGTSHQVAGRFKTIFDLFTYMVRDAPF